MKNVLFLVFREFHGFNGISKKMIYQIDALKADGVNVETCYLSMDEQQVSRRMLDDQVMVDFGRGFISKIRKRIDFTALVNYVLSHDIDLMYIRYEHNASPFFIKALKKIRAKGVKIILEIPTYPYDREYRRQGLQLKLHLLIDQCFRRRLAKLVDRIVTFSNDPTIFHVPTIRISNGINFETVPLKQSGRIQEADRINLIGVAEIHLWHGFDRLIQGLADYYATPQKVQVYFDVVGYSTPAYMRKLEQLVQSKNLTQYVVFHGAKFDGELDAFFDRADMGVGSLARHRSGVVSLKSLKNREYAARGVPFVYSETDDDFDEMSYVLKVEPDDSPIDISRLIDHYRTIQITSQEIRDSISHLSWKVQMQKVLHSSLELVSSVLLVNNYDMSKSRRSYLSGGSPSHHQFGVAELLETGGYTVDDMLVAPTNGLSRLGKLCSLFPLWFKLYKKARRYDYVYGAADYTVDFLGILKKVGLFKPKLITIFHHPPFGLRIRIGRYNKILFLSEFACTEQQAAFPKKRESMVFLQWGPDLAFYHNNVQIPNYLTAMDEVVFVSNGKTNRDHESLVTATEQLKVKTVIVSDDKSLPKNYHANSEHVMIYRQNSPDDEKMVKLLNRCSVLVVSTPPTKQMLGPIGLTSFLDAVALGMPIITADNTVFAHLVLSYQMGVVYKAGSISDLSAKMTLFTEDKSLIRSFGENAYRFGEKNDIKTFAAGLKKVFEQL